LSHTSVDSSFNGSVKKFLNSSCWAVTIYFDTFPDHFGLDPVAEAQTNIAAVQRLMAAANLLAGNTELTQAIARQDAPLSMRIVHAAMFA
jgi:hypothetical protein